ncbi:MAG TPA: peptidoglycan DD-metalloendopeptidase family protein [Pedobacter sp.]|nr:peptidoglycan DD-metalloendopeptidase family protein [Pedobacter sp.]
MNSLLSAAGIGKVVDFDPLKDQLYKLDLTAANKELSNELLDDTDLFSDWISGKLEGSKCRYGIGGYNEHRTVYARSAHFDTADEPRRLHLGVDIWGPAGTKIYNFQEATVHSFKFNDSFGDYGATIILSYVLEGRAFHVLYGHLNLAALDGLKEGQAVGKGVQFAVFGRKEENGCWPPHLHFQLIMDMEGLKGDYPGVCQYSKRAHYLTNCPDPEIFLKHTFQPALA